TRAVSRAIRVIYSALESAVLEQVQDASRPAVSATRLLQLNNALGRRTFLVHAGNWATIRPQLVNYYEWQLQDLSDEINGGSRLVLPEDAETPLEDWLGLGYISYVPGWEDWVVGLVLSGFYTPGGSGGGQVATSSTLDREMLLEALEYWMGVPADQDPTVSTPQSGDPIDMATGACVYATTDLAVGPAEPFGLRLERSYNSGTHYYEQVLGRGWRHNYQMTVQERSKGDLALGMGQPAEAAAMIAAAHVVADLLPGEADVVEWMASVLASKWAADQVLHNTLTVQLGSQMLEFTRLPDGSYSPPPGVVLRLTETAGGYLLENAAGARYEFDAAGRVVRWQDANTNAVTFTYDGGGMLQNVSNGLGITLTFAYSGTQLCQVTDMAGRSVRYDYTDGNLTSYSDALSNTWYYEYDEENRLSAIYSPNSPGTAIITNVYDDLNQVEAQTDGLGNTTFFAFSGFRNTEENPDGSRAIHYFDRRGNYVGREDATGRLAEMKYDGLRRLRTITDRLGNDTSFAFDAQSGNPASYTNAEGQT
ncbi:MAG: RHS repeat protein, partial [Chloroflexi bacterium]|nr:RHS repeat protein [Chloroflexota bacterium]